MKNLIITLFLFASTSILLADGQNAGVTLINLINGTNTQGVVYTNLDQNFTGANTITNANNVLGGNGALITGVLAAGVSGTAVTNAGLIAATNNLGKTYGALMTNALNSFAGTFTGTHTGLMTGLTNAAGNAPIDLTATNTILATATNASVAYAAAVHALFPSNACPVVTGTTVGYWNSNGVHGFWITATSTNVAF